MPARLFLQTNRESVNGDLLDNLIYVTIILFILSVITEKFTQLIRMYPAKFRAIAICAGLLFYYPLMRAAFAVDTTVEGSGSFLAGIIILFIANTFSLVIIVANTRQARTSTLPVQHLASLRNIAKDKNAPQETKEREVTILSFIIGLVVAYAFQANLFSLFQSPPLLGWKDAAPLMEDQGYALNPEYFSLNIIAIIGFLLTAFFLAFGSKFFHDLLDTLFYAKNLKRHLSDKETFNVESADQLRAILKHTQGSMIKLAIQQNKERLEKLPNFFSVHEGTDLQTGEKIVFLNIKDSNLVGIPDTLTYQLEGTSRTVRVRIIPNVEIATVSSGRIYNEQTSNFIGSIGVPFTFNQQLWLLTCGHVMLGGNFDPATQQGLLANPGLAQFYFRRNNPAQGDWLYGYQDLEFDIALIRPHNANEIPSTGLAADPFALAASTSLITVSFKGAVSEGTGYVISQDVEEPIKFANTTVQMKGLIKIAAGGGLGSISQPGDSGAALITSDNQAVAIILASSSLYTYALSLEKIFAGWNAKIY